MWSFLLLLALSVRVSVALTLSGPNAIFACDTSLFSWTDGTPPYTFHPLVGTSDTSILAQAIQGVLTNSTSWYINGSPGSVYQFLVVDSVGEVSNVLSYTVQDSGGCAAASTATQGSIPLTIEGTTTEISSGAGPAVASTVTIAVPTQTRVLSAESSRIAYPTASVTVASDAAMTLRLSLSTILTIVATVGGALFLIISLCCWKWCKARKAHKVERRSQPRQLMKNANLNGSGLLLTDSSSSRQYGPVPSTPNNGDATMLATPLATHVLPSSKERRMRGAVNREPDLEDGLSISDISAPLSTAHSTSIWPASTIASPENSPSRTQSQEPALRNQQSLQAIIGREIQEILHSSESRTSPTSFTNTPSPLFSLNDLPSLHTSANDPVTLKPPIIGKPALSLEIPQANRDPRSILVSATTPISRRDMEVLADLVAQRLISGRAVESSARDQNPEAPPPRYS